MSGLEKFGVGIGTFFDNFTGEVYKNGLEVAELRMKQTIECDGKLHTDEETFGEYCSILYNGCVKMYICRGTHGLVEQEKGLKDRLNEYYNGPYKVDNTPSQDMINSVKAIKLPLEVKKFDVF